jgi:hypothetical protein
MLGVMIAREGVRTGRRNPEHPKSGNCSHKDSKNTKKKQIIESVAPIAAQVGRSAEISR